MHYRGVRTRAEASEPFLEGAWRRPSATAAGVRDAQAGMLQAKIRSQLCFDLISARGMAAWAPRTLAGIAAGR